MSLNICSACEHVLAREAILYNMLLHRFKEITPNGTIGFDKDTEQPIKRPPKLIN